MKKMKVFLTVLLVGMFALCASPALANKYEDLSVGLLRIEGTNVTPWINALVSGNLALTSSTLVVSGTASVGGDTTLSADLDVGSNVVVAGSLTVTGVVTGVTTGEFADVHATDDLFVDNDGTISGDLGVTSNASVGALLDVDGAADLASTLAVAGALTCSNAATFSSSAQAFTVAATNISFAGLPTVAPAASGSLWRDGTNLVIVP